MARSRSATPSSIWSIWNTGFLVLGLLLVASVSFPQAAFLKIIASGTESGTNSNELFC